MRERSGSIELHGSSSAPDDDGLAGTCFLSMLGPINMGHSPTRVASLDGVRGLAIVVVLIHHAVQYGAVQQPVGWQLSIERIAKEGWIGVDLFFVLSGYLITGILLRTREKTHYFRDFYARRTLRIFPLYYACVFVMCVALPLLRDRDYLRELHDHQLWYWFYIPNFRIALNGNWPGSPFDHVWSLAIEEQFYLVWPLVVWVLGARRLITGTIALALGSVAIRHWMWMHTFSGAQIRVLPFSHCEGLALGSLLACLEAIRVPAARIRHLAIGLIVFGLALRVTIGLTVREPPIPSEVLLGTGWTLFFGGIIAWLTVSNPNSTISRIFSARVLTFFGTYSYGLYLIHLPLMCWGSPYVARLPGMALNSAVNWTGELVICGGSAALLAVLSYKYFEMPFLRLKSRFE